MRLGRSMVWTGAAMVLGVQLSMVPPVAAHDAPPDEGRVCNPVNHGDKIPVLTKDGRFVKHGGTADCPPPPAEPVAEPAPAPEPKVITIQGDVAFDLNKANIKPAFEPTLNEIADELNASPDTKLEVVGHADSTGTDAYNQGLSERRAQAVADYLVGRGVAADRFSVSGRGESEPVESNATREGRAKNRRVEIRSM